MSTYPTSMTADALLEQNFLEKISFYPKRHPLMKVLRYDSITCVDSLLPSDTFNCVFGGNFTETQTSSQIEWIVDYYTQQQFPMAWWVGPNAWSSQADMLLTKAGLTLNETEIGMIAPSNLFNCEQIQQPNLQIVKVAAPQQLKDFGYVLASIFDPFDEYALNFYELNSAFIQDGDAKAYVGYVANQPVVIGSLCLGSQMTGIYDIATHPDQRRKGYGTAMTAFVFEQAQGLGNPLIGLLASTEGLPLYKKMGFQAYGKFYVYGNQQLLNAK